MEVNVKEVLKTRDGKTFQIPVDVKKDENGKDVPVFADLTLGLTIVEALGVSSPRTLIPAVEMVRRDRLAGKVMDALEGDGLLTLTTDHIAKLKTQIELLNSERGVSIPACAAALTKIAPDDFNEE